VKEVSMRMLRISHRAVLYAIVFLAFPVLTVAADAPARKDFAHPEFIVSVAELKDRLATSELVIIDTRRFMDYRLGHIPGAVHLSPPDLERAQTLANGEKVTNLVMEAHEITPKLQAAGIDPESRIVIYDQGRHVLAARLWWMLDYYGHENIAILDGGFGAWKTADGPLERGEPEARPDHGSFVAHPHPEKHADYEYVKANLGSGATAVCDALSAESYAEGAIPGSLNLPQSDTVDASTALLKSAEELRAMLAQLDIGPEQEIVFYCGAGYAAAQDYFVARALGIERVRLYDGSLRDWRARGGEVTPSGERL
jgi:thiosulfate/3-mercaptopyruvate sulfurtransferase